ncbi:DMT family transporter [Paraburkholderia sp. Ac-20340]|nr:DMT family transporter [Paraburkholderia sp. Ac-20340]
MYFGLAYVAAIVSVLIWAILPYLIKSSLHTIPLFPFLIFRFSVSTLILSHCIRSIYRKAHRLNLTIWLKIALTSTLIYVLQALALEDIPASVYVVFFSATPVLTIVLLRLPMARRAWAATGVCVVALCAFIWSGRESTGQIPLLGAMSMLGGMVCWAYYTVFIHRIQKEFSDIEVAQIMNLFGLASSVFLWIILDREITAIPRTAIVFPVTLGIVVPFGYALFSFALRHTPIFAVTSQYLEPIASISISCLLLGEALNPIQIFSATLCIGSALVVDRYSEAQRANVTS